MTPALAAAYAYCDRHNLPKTVGEEVDDANPSHSSYVEAYLEGWEGHQAWLDSLEFGGLKSFLDSLEVKNER